MADTAAEITKEASERLEIGESLAIVPKDSQVISHPTGNLVKDDPKAAGRRGALKRQENVQVRIAKARDILGYSAPGVARTAVKVAMGEQEIGQVQMAAVRDVLDRTVGKAPTELRIGPAEQTLSILRELEA